MAISDTAVSTGLCTVVRRNELVVYNIWKGCVVLSVKLPNEEIKTKMVKISPSNKTIAWLQNSPNQIVFVDIDGRTNTTLAATSDVFPWEYLLWSPTADVLAVCSSLGIFIDVFSVEAGQATYLASVSGAKQGVRGSPLVNFSPDGDYFSTVTGSSEGDCILIYTTKDYSWNCVQKVRVSGCVSVGGCLWCHDCASLLVWPAQAGLEPVLLLYGLDGLLKQRYTSHMTNVCLTRCGRMAAMQSDDGGISILDLLIWRLDGNGSLRHCPIVHESSARLRIKESDQDSEVNRKEEAFSSHVIMDIKECETIKETLYELHQDTTRAADAQHLQFSVDANYIASYEPVYPNVLWVWNPTLTQPLDTLIVLKENCKVLGLLWHKSKPMLCASLSHNRTLVWTPENTKILTPKTQSWPLNAQNYLSNVYYCEDHECSNI